MVSAAELGILADDLTGACDAAAAFAPATGSVGIHVLLPRRGAADGDAGLAVFNMQSRLLDARRSRRRATRAGRLLRDPRILYVKTDSVLRGAVGAELEGLSRAFPGRRIVLVPAIPEMGKTTSGGRLFERGIPAHLTEYGRDPVTPILTNDVRAIIGATGRVELDVEDAETALDIDRAVGRALEGGHVILAGSVGLADALARVVRSQPGPAPAAREGRRVVIVCGSGYPTARGQLQRAATAFGTNVISLGKGSAVSRLVRVCKGRELVLLQIETEPVHPARRARWSLHRLFCQVGRLIRFCEPDGLGIIGGETAFRILRRLGVTRLSVDGRLEPGVAYGTIVDGALAGAGFSSKGGSVGGEDACVLMVERLRRRVA